MVDRLRQVGCPAEIRAAICGWTIKNIEVRYGAGYGIEEPRAWMLKIENADHLSVRYAPPQRERSATHRKRMRRENEGVHTRARARDARSNAQRRSPDEWGIGTRLEVFARPRATR